MEFSLDHSGLEQLAQELIELGRLSEAEQLYRKIIENGGTGYVAYGNLGACCLLQGKIDQSILLFRKSLEINPGYAQARNNLGVAIKEKGYLLSAIACYREALAHQPNYPDAFNNLGLALHEYGDMRAAESAYSAALGCQPDFVDANFNYALLLLIVGRYRLGWEKFEWRLKSVKSSLRPHVLPRCKFLDRKSDVNSKRVLVVSEQGLGDTLQFMRYLKLLECRGCDVYFCPQNKLHSLIRSSNIGVPLLTAQEASEAFDGEWMPLMSIPGRLGVEPGLPLTAGPYINSDNILVEKWKKILSSEGRPVIGINWQGNPAAETTTLKGRSFELEAFAPVVASVDASFLSLQKGCGSEQLSSFSFRERFVACQDLVDDAFDFLETSAIIANCDLVITCDTAVAHLAGGMGKPTWLLLHKVPDWRWGLDGDTTFWYPSMRLFRQINPGDWGDVFRRVSIELCNYLSEKNVADLRLDNRSRSLEANKIRGVTAPISVGELIDKITILEIKERKLNGAARLNVLNELELLESVREGLKCEVDHYLIGQLRLINQELWEVEDAIRDHERSGQFDDVFIDLARSVYKKNDYRAALKKQINMAHGSEVVEEKSYQNY